MAVEYKIVRYKFTNDEAANEAFLNALGAEGWRWCHLIGVMHEGRSRILFSRDVSLPMEMPEEKKKKA